MNSLDVPTTSLAIMAMPSMNGVMQIVVYLGVLLALVKPLGWYMACVFEGRTTPMTRVLGPIERLMYRFAGVRALPAAQRDASLTGGYEEMGWKKYALAALLFNLLGFLAVFALQRFQAGLPWNPQQLAGVEAGSAFNTAISFMTNTNWQGYGGEVTMSYLTQMLGLGVQNFLSAATGMAVLAAIARGLHARRANKQASAPRGAQATIGNFWVDVTRSTLYILLPLSILLAIALVGQGVVQSFKPYQAIDLTVPLTAGDGTLHHTQTIPLGPAASQIAIKQLGTNGGGFFNVNSAHPLENPTAISNFLQCLAILLIPAALCFTFGEMVRDRRQGWALLAAMTAIFVVTLFATSSLEQAGSPALAQVTSANAPPTTIDASITAAQPGGNMEGKEARFGIANSALWAVATTAASNGSVNSMHDSYTPLGGMIPMWLMQLGEVVYGGAGSGLYGMLLFVIIAVFVAGLMVGRTPEYLGKKIGPFEMKMASIGILIPCMLVLVGTAIAVMTPLGATTSNPGPHGFSQILYALSSASNNNGSAFAGLTANTPFYNTLLGICMFFGRFGVLVPVLAIAGSMAAKQAGATTGPRTLGTLPTHTGLFVALLIAVVVIVGALTFVPSLALGPIVEQLQLSSAAK